MGKASRRKQQRNAIGGSSAAHAHPKVVHLDPFTIRCESGFSPEQVSSYSYIVEAVMEDDLDVLQHAAHLFEVSGGSIFEVCITSPGQSVELNLCDLAFAARKSDCLQWLVSRALNERPEEHLKRLFGLASTIFELQDEDHELWSVSRETMAFAAQRIVDGFPTTRLLEALASYGHAPRFQRMAYDMMAKRNAAEERGALEAVCQGPTARANRASGPRI